MRTILSLLFALGNIFATHTALASPTPHEVRDLASGQIKTCQCEATPDDSGLRCTNCTAATKTQFPIWKRVKIGTYKSIADIRGALKRARIEVEPCADDVLNGTMLAPQRSTVDLVLVTVAQLGFPQGANTQDLYARAREHDLELCRAEVGPQLRLQYKNKFKIFVGMEPITISSGYPAIHAYPSVFVLAYEDGRNPWLDNVPAWQGNGDGFSEDAQFVFCLPAQTGAHK